MYAKFAERRRITQKTEPIAPLKISKSEYLHPLITAPKILSSLLRRRELCPRTTQTLRVSQCPLVYPAPVVMGKKSHNQNRNIILTRQTPPPFQSPHQTHHLSERSQSSPLHRPDQPAPSTTRTPHRCSHTQSPQYFSVPRV